MMTKEEAIEIAKEAVCIEKKWTIFPTEAVLTSAYFSKRDRWVFEWKHETDLCASEIDRILVWLSETGEVIKMNIAWELSKMAKVLSLIRRRKLRYLSVPELKKRMERRVELITGFDVTITKYTEIKKEIYVFFIPEGEIKNYYWIGRTDNRILLIDVDGRIVGELVMPSSEYSVSSGHMCGPGYCSDSDWCWCWFRVVSIAKGYYEKWFNEKAYGCGPKVVGEGDNEEDCTMTHPGKNYISLDDYDSSISNIHTKASLCVAHGSNTCYYFVPYPRNTAYTATKQQRIDWGCHNSIEELFESRGPIRLGLLIHCAAMDSTGEGTIEYYFRGKGKTENTSVIGLKHTTKTSWSAFYNWLPFFLNDIDSDRDKKIKESYDDGVDTYPDINGHIVFTGDKDLTLDQIIKSDMCKVS